MLRAITPQDMVLCSVDTLYPTVSTDAICVDTSECNGANLGTRVIDSLTDCCDSAVGAGGYLFPVPTSLSVLCISCRDRKCSHLSNLQHMTTSLLIVQHYQASKNYLLIVNELPFFGINLTNMYTVLNYHH